LNSSDLSKDEEGGNVSPGTSSNNTDQLNRPATTSRGSQRRKLSSNRGGRNGSSSRALFEGLKRQAVTAIDFFASSSNPPETHSNREIVTPLV
jgi:hypothetical protein